MVADRMITIEGAGAVIGALHLDPIGPRKGGLVILHEIFGIDRNMREDAARWAAQGFEVLVPSLFDRCEAGFVAEHNAKGIQRGFACLAATPDSRALGDIAACIDRLIASGPVFAIGYCYGGRLAWLAAQDPRLSAIVCYYGNMLGHIALAPKCRAMVHLGGLDPHLPVTEIIAELAQHHPGVATFLYSGSGHGFNNSGVTDARAEDAELARSRTRDLLDSITTGTSPQASV